MDNGTATRRAYSDNTVNGSGVLLSSASPTFMEKLDAKTQEQITITKGTAWLLATMLVLVMIVFNYGGSMLSWARSDQSQTEQIQQMQNALKGVADSQIRMEQRFEKLDERLREQERFQDKVAGFKAGVAETQSDKGKK